MKIILCTLALLLGYFSIATAQHPFYDAIEYTRISCNFNGSVASGGVLLVYGDGGIILRSTNGGNDWERINLSDSLNIIGMVSAGNTFIGMCSEKYAVVSSDGGKSWVAQDVGSTQCYQILAKDNVIYALGKDKVWTMNPKLEKIKEYSVTTGSLYNSFTLVGTTIACSFGDGKLLMINTTNDQQQSIPLSGIVSGSNYQIKMPITSNGSTLLYFAVGTNLYQYTIATSTANLRLQLLTTKGSVFAHYNDDVYFLYTLNNTPFATLDSLYFVKADTISSQPLHIKKPGNDRYIIGLSFRNLRFITKDTILAVGTNHLIYMSFNGGIDWELKSSMAQFQNIVLFDSLSARSAGAYGQMHHTNNGGITWLPQKTYQNIFRENERFYSPANYQGTSFFKDKDHGFVGVSLYATGDTNLIFTNNGGNTVLLTSTNIIREDFETYALEHSGKYILFTWGCIGHDLGCWTVIYKLNDTLGVEHKTAIRGWQMFYATNYNGTLYALGKDSSDTDTSLYSVFISEDAGTSWKKDFTLQLPFTPYELRARNCSRIGNSIFVNWNSLVLQPNDSSFRQNYFKIDLTSKTARKIATIKADGGQDIVKIGTSYFLGNYTYLKSGGIGMNLLTSSTIDQDSVQWTPLPFRRLGFPYISNFTSDSLFSFVAVDSTSGNYGLYFARAKRVNSVGEATIDNTSPMYISAPQPQPARDVVRMRLSYDQSLNIDNAEFTAFDVLGVGVSHPADFTFNRLTSYSGEIVWKLSSSAPGIYFVRCRIGLVTCTVPVLIQ